VAKYAVGLILGAVVGFVVAFVALPDDESIKDDRDLEGEVARLQRTVDEMGGKLDEAVKARKTAEGQRDVAVADLEKATVEDVEIVDGPPPDSIITDSPVGVGGGVGGAEPAETAALDLDALRSEAMGFGSSLQKIILGGGEEEKKALRDAFAGVSAETLNALIDEFKTSSSMGTQLMLAHALAQSGRPEAIAALRETLMDTDGGLMLRRTASHGLAFAQVEGMDGELVRIARSDPDNGVRANVAFGLAKRGHSEGVRLYMEATDTAFEKKDPAALQYLGGIGLLGDDAKPYVRERLERYTGKQERLVLIQFVQSGKDTEALPILDRIAQTDESPDIRAAAETAARVIRGE